MAPRHTDPRASCAGADPREPEPAPRAREDPRAPLHEESAASAGRRCDVSVPGEANHKGSESGRATEGSDVERATPKTRDSTDAQLVAKVGGPQINPKSATERPTSTLDGPEADPDLTPIRPQIDHN